MADCSYEDQGHCPNDVCAYNAAAEACYDPKVWLFAAGRGL